MEAMEKTTADKPAPDTLLRTIELNTAPLKTRQIQVCWDSTGVVPRQYSTGGKQKLFGMSKRGNIYLRRMLIHGARAVLFRIKYDTVGLGQWVHRLSQRAPRNKVVVAIANKLARIAWAVLSSGRDYRHQPLQSAAA
jgi:hypothetical protein